MKMLKFTNRGQGRAGDPIYINSDWIVSVYEEYMEGGSLSTIIYGGPHNATWFVEEGLKEVIDIIESAK